MTFRLWRCLPFWPKYLTPVIPIYVLYSLPCQQLQGAMQRALTTRPQPSFSCRPPNMCKASPAANPPNLSPHIDQQGGVHVKGVHTLSLALSGSAIFGVAVLVFLYCLISKRRCCASPSVESPVSLQLQPPAATSAQPQGQLMPTAPSAYMLQPADVENQLALLRAQQELQMAMLRHQQAKDQTADVTMPPGRMMAIDNNKFLVV